MTKALSASSNSRSRQFLTRILEEPELVGIVQGLEAPVLSKLIDHIGLEDSGEIVALATTEQLKKIFDEDLWRSAKPGKDPTFDAERFGLWLQVMMEAGAEFAARKLAELDEDLVTLAVCKHVLVINIDALAERISGSSRSDDDGLTDKALESCLYEEFSEYQIIARDHQGWDSLIAVLVELDKNHHDFLMRMLDRCCYISTEYIDDNGGLYNVLNSEEMLESDVAADREDRREAEGYVAPSSAASFLNLARVTPTEELIASRDADPITQSYFKSLDRAARESAKKGPAQALPRGAPSRKVEKFLQELREAEVLEAPAQPPLLAAGEPRAAHSEPLFKLAVLAVRDREPKAYMDRLRELGYLANVLISGCVYAGRAFRPLEAADAAVAVCNLGMERLLRDAAGDRPGVPTVDDAAGLLERQELVKLFQVGWSLLHRDVQMFTARTLQETLARMGEGLRDVRKSKELTRMAATLKADVNAGKPCQSRSRLEGLGNVLDRQVILAVKGLLSEYPYLTRAISGGSKEMDKGDSRFIFTQQQIQAVQAFVQGIGAPAKKAGVAAPPVPPKGR
ncbi:hypothetical protein D7Y21_36080 [Corallococcus sp. AB045]|uniref:DUF6178 family protein n=1 Tax=Corallococcus sp. AB045 TaxID=2316719 RepID=UPI000EC26AC8|nr:DUF6178 family protein [Corallococcus sp. AB045]RKH78224.1 hypothetical protein D7Y21_36080 [Corallococcus sp. AB045]